MQYKSIINYYKKISKNFASNRKIGIGKYRKKMEANRFSFSNQRYDIFIKRITRWMRTLSSCFELSIVFVLLREKVTRKEVKRLLQIKSTLVYLISWGKINTIFLKSMVERCSVRFNLEGQSLYFFQNIFNLLSIFYSYLGVERSIEFFHRHLSFILIFFYSKIYTNEMCAGIFMDGNKNFFVRSKYGLKIILRRQKMMIASITVQCFIHHD